MKKVETMAIVQNTSKDNDTNAKDYKKIKWRVSPCTCI